MPFKLPIKVYLNEDEIPRQWYNLAADLPTPMLPPLGPDGKPLTPEALSAVFPMNLIEQEVSQERWITIPEEIIEMLYRWRPSPLKRAVYLEQALARQQKSIIRTRASLPREATNPIPLSRRSGTTRNLVQRRSPRNGRRPMGQRPGVLLLAYGARMQDLYGENQL